MARIAGRVGRVALVAAAVGTGLLLGFGWVLRQPNTGRLPFPGSRRADAAALEAHVRALTTLDPPRHWQTPEGLERAATYVASHLDRTGARRSEQVYRAGGIETRNVIAAFGPANGARVIVGAHYDVFGGLPGADDNASGVAGLLELARLLDGVPLASPVELVAYSTEEPPFFAGPDMGSAVHAASLARSGAAVRAMISLEMIGCFSARQPDHSWLLDAIYPRRGDFVSLVGRWQDRGLVRRAKKAFRGVTSVPVVSYSGPVAVGADLSDQRSYWAAGFPAFMVTDTAFLRNPSYHTDRDTADTLDFGSMAGVVDGVLATVVDLASAAAR